jgi:hypothetical protein
MCKNLDSPHPLTPFPIFGRRGTRIMSPLFGRGAGGEGKDLSLHWDAPTLSSVWCVTRNANAPYKYLLLFKNQTGFLYK